MESEKARLERLYWEWRDSLSAPMGEFYAWFHGASEKEKHAAYLKLLPIAAAAKLSNLDYKSPEATIDRMRTYGYIHDPTP